MILLDRVIESTDQYTICSVDIKREGVLAPFITEEGTMPSWCFIELMAQTIGVWNGVRLDGVAKRPNIALLLGIRGFSSSIDSITIGKTLFIKCDLVLFDETICNFKCEIVLDNQKIATGSLVVLEPTEQMIHSLFDWNKK